MIFGSKSSWRKDATGAHHGNGFREQGSKTGVSPQKCIECMFAHLYSLPSQYIRCHVSLLARLQKHKVSKGKAYDSRGYAASAMLNMMDLEASETLHYAAHYSRSEQSVVAEEMKGTWALLPTFTSTTFALRCALRFAIQKLSPAFCPSSPTARWTCRSYLGTSL